MDEDSRSDGTATPVLRAARGATTVERDEPDTVLEATASLLTELLQRNGIVADDVVSIVFTATGDLRSVFPAEAARRMGMIDVPLLCARELDVEGAMPSVVRVLVHFHTVRPRSDVAHVYLEGARSLRDDLA
jgi:chorismate mutase